MIWNLVVWAVARLREPSTYAGLIGVLAYFNVPDASSWAHDLTMAGMGVAGVAAMILKEARAPDK